MQPRRLIASTGILLAAAGATLYLAAATFGATSRTAGTIQLFITPALTGRGGGAMVLTGAIGDYGKATKTNAAGQPDPTGAYSRANLHYGTILLNTAPLRHAIQVGIQHAQPDLASCSLQGSARATVPIISGTGNYAGISGNVRAQFTFAEVAGRFTKGAKKGKCNLDAGPVAQWASITGSGTVSFK